MDKIIYEEAAAYAQTILDLYRTGCRDMGEYQKIIPLVPAFPLKRYRDEIGDRLQDNMDGIRMLVTGYRDTDAVRAMAGITAVRSKVYHMLKASGIGAMLDFSFKGKSLQVGIVFRKSVRRKPFDTVKDMEKRLWESAENSGFAWTESKAGLYMNLKYSPDNMQKVGEWLGNMFQYSNLHVEIGNGLIRKVTLRIQEIYDACKDTEEGMAVIEEIAADAESMLKDLATTHGIDGVAQEFLNQKLASDCFHICTLAGCECSFTKEYTEKMAVCRARNADTRKQVMSLGETVPFGEMADTAWKLQDNMQEKLETWYGAYSETETDQYGLRGAMHFSLLNICMEEHTNGFKLADIVEKDDDTYYIPYKKMETVKDIMERDGLQLNGVSSKCNGDILYVDSVIFCMPSFWESAATTE